jgi:uncharacterized protein (DUF433 family)
MATETKRQNFNITPEQEAELTWLRETLGVSSTKDAILRAVRVLAILAREVQQGRALYLGTAAGELTRLLIPELQSSADNGWEYLVARPHPWRRQLYVKGRKLRASTVWMDMQANEMTLEEAADDWDLPLAAIEEIIRYCESHRQLLSMEAEEERRRLLEAGVPLEPPTAR